MQQTDSEMCSHHVRACTVGSSCVKVKFVLVPVMMFYCVQRKQIIRIKVPVQVCDQPTRNVVIF